MYSIVKYILAAITAVALIAFEYYSIKKPTSKTPARSVPTILELINRPAVSVVCFGVLFALFLFTRLFHLGIAPAGLHIDECGLCYDAVCIANEGTDRFGYSHPVYFCNFHTGQSALYTYMLALLLKIAPFSAKLARTPAVIAASVAFIAMFGIGRRLTRSNLGGLIACSLMIITPYYLTSERWALDCNLFLSLSIISFFLVLNAIDTKKTLYYVIAGLSLGLTLYTYIISYLAIPVFALITIIVIIIDNRKHGISFKAFAGKLAGMILPIGVLGLPLLIEQLVNLGVIGEFKLLGIDFYVFSSGRTEEFVPSNFFKNIGVLSKQLVSWDGLEYNALPAFGALLLPMVVLAVYGLYLCLKKIIRGENRVTMILVLAFFAAGYLVNLMMKIPNFNRYNELFLPLLIFNLLAICEPLHYIATDSARSSRRSTLIALPSIISAISVIICFMFFGKYYFMDMNDEYRHMNLFCSTEILDMITRSEELYDTDRDKDYSICIEYDSLAGQDLLIAARGNVASADWRAYDSGLSGTKLGRFDLNFDDQSINDNTIYIIGTSWNFISGYLEQIGFNTDREHYRYTIQWK